MSAPVPTRLTAGRTLARNSLINLLGHLAPLLVALVAIPPLIAGMGEERFGVLTIAWMVIGYFSLFDLGLSRALTQLVAERLGTGAEEEIPRLAGTALLLMFGLGVAGGGVLALAAPWLTGTLLRIPPELRGEALGSLYLLALSLPWVISTAGLRGILEASQRFGMVNALRIPLGMLTYLGPLLVIPFSVSLVPVTAVLVAGRVAIWAGHAACCLRVLPGLREAGRFRSRYVPGLLRFGGWMTVSNIVSPVMVSFDRFLIGAVISMSAVAYYVTPYEMVAKLLLVPSALIGVFFPAFAASYAADRPRVAALFDRAVRVLLVLLFPICLVLVVGAYDGLRLWLGSDFATRSAPVLQWLAIGVFVNGVGFIPFALLQGAGRPDLTGKLHLAELPLYAAAIWWLTMKLGITGAAIAWTGRVVLDTGVLFALTARLLPESRGLSARLGTTTGVLAAVLALGMLPERRGQAIAMLAGVLVVFAVGSWSWVLTPRERALLRALRPTSPVDGPAELPR